MSQNKKTNLFYGLAVIALATLITAAIISAWTEPSSAPPTGNVSAPINVGSATQYKSGALGIGGVFRAYSTAIFDELAIQSTSSVPTPIAGYGKLYVKGDNNLYFLNPSGKETNIIAGAYVAPEDRFKRIEKCLAQGVTNIFCKKINASENCVNQSLKEDLFGECSQSACKGDGTCISTTCSACQYFDKASLTCKNIPAGKDGPDYGLSDFCSTATGPCAADSCNGSGGCASLTGEYSASACKRCDGTSVNYVNIGSGLKDEEGTNTCTATHYRCDGGGGCKAPSVLVNNNKPICSWGSRIEADCDIYCANLSNYTAFPDSKCIGEYYDGKYGRAWCTTAPTLGCFTGSCGEAPPADATYSIDCCACGEYTYD